MIELRDIQVKYNEFIAIDNIRFRVEDGEFFTLLGPSGCGKSTTLRAIAGFLNPSKGSITVDGKEITHIPVENRNLGMVFQSYALFPTMTVFDNIAYGLQVEKQPKLAIERRVGELASLVELSQEQLLRNVSDLSGGQQQRVAIARALAKKPALVLFDEPLSNLDAKLRKQLRYELKQIQKDTGMTAIYVTHDQEEALELSDKIAVFNNGKIDQIGSPEEIYNSPATEFVCNFIGEANLLGRELMEVINENSDIKFSLDKKHYLREEKIRLNSLFSAEQSSITFTGIIKNVTFYGTTTTIVLEIEGSLVKTLVKNESNHVYQIGQAIQIYIDPQDILEYEG